MDPGLQATLAREILGNTVRSYLGASVTFLAALAALFILRNLLLAKLKALAKRTTTDLDDFLVDLLGKVRSPEYHLIAFYLGTRSLSLSGGFNNILHVAFVAVLSYRAVTLLQAAAAYGLRKLTKAPAHGDPTSASALRNIQIAADALIWAGAAIFVLDNLGINISTVVAGLGIGGIAVAMASQQILGDLFSSFAIFLDKPFKVGQAISVDGLEGSVEHVGIKTTRVRSVNGELLVFPNQRLTSSVFRNYGVMTTRRVVSEFCLVYGTPSAKLKAACGWLRAAVEAAPRARFERAHLRGLGPSGAEFELVYHVEGPDYALCMEVRQAVNFAVLDKLEAEGVSLAYPTRTVLLQKS